jgi:AcrR family transcriptional regulator
MSAARTPKGRAPHRRNEEARIKVLHAADDLLVERGFAGVSVEGIAARAGVAKQTIYRWWPSKVDILLDTLIEDTALKLVIPERGTAVDRLRKYLRSFATFLTKDDAGKVLLALLGEAQHDAETAKVFQDRYLKPRRAMERALLKSGVDDGELPEDINIDAALDVLIGPIVYRALTGAPIPPRFVDGLIASTLTR